MNGRADAERPIRRATRSFPVPVSPRTSTCPVPCASNASRRRTSAASGDAPGNASRSPSPSTSVDDGGNVRNTSSVLPSRSTAPSPSAMRAPGANGTPSTKPPLRLPRSVSVQPRRSRSIRACARDSRGSSNTSSACAGVTRRPITSPASRARTAPAPAPCSTTRCAARDGSAARSAESSCCSVIASSTTRRRAYPKPPARRGAHPFGFPKSCGIAADRGFGRDLPRGSAAGRLPGSSRRLRGRARALLRPVSVGCERLALRGPLRLTVAPRRL